MKSTGVQRRGPEYDIIATEDCGRIFKHQQMLDHAQRPAGTHFIKNRDWTRTQRTQRPQGPPPVAMMLFLKAPLCAQMSSRRKKGGERRG